jgi:hypothetical protein
MQQAIAAKEVMSAGLPSTSSDIQSQSN